MAELGDTVARWIEANLCHGPGDVQGSRIFLDDEQYDFLCDVYDTKPSGRRRYRRAWYSAPKGRAKSELAAMVACAELLGPVRMRDGVPSTVEGPVIPCVALEEKQATSSIYDVARYMLQNGAVAATPGLDVGMTRTYAPGGGEMRAISSTAASKDGGRETFVVMDETHLMVNDALRRLHRTLIRNLTKRKIADPWMLEVGTMYAPGEDSVAERTHDHAKAIAEGRLKDEGLLVRVSQGPEPDKDFDYSDDAALADAFRVAYGEASEWMDIARLVEDARDPTAERDEVVRFFLNRPAARGSQWMPAGVYDAAAVEDVLEEGAQVALALHGDVWNGVTALVAVELAEDPRFQLLEHWTGTPEAPVDHALVDESVRAAFDRFTVPRFYVDPQNFETTAAQWQAERGKSVRGWPTRRHREFAEGCESLRSALKTSAAHPVADDVMRSHFLAASLVERYQHLVISKPSKSSIRRINAATAAVLAWVARTDSIAAGERRARSARMQVW